MRFGIIGCGTITETAYLPVFKKFPANLTALVDVNTERLSDVARGRELSYAGMDIRKMHDHVDAVIIAVPNHLHSTVCKACLEAGKHVLCEKPLAISGSECEDMVAISNRYAMKLGVAHVRRFYPAVREIKEIISSDKMGAALSFNFSEGTVFSWPSITGFIFDKVKAGGGVLMDIGVHLLDLLFWWLPYEVADIVYADDNVGGVEACANIKITLSNGVKGTVKLSRLSVLNNFYSLYFEKGIIRWNPFSPRRIYLQENDQKLKTITFRKTDPVKQMLLDFVDSIQKDRQPFVTGGEAAEVIKTIEKCYSSRRLLPMSWLTMENADNDDRNH